ncbi:MAG: phage holin family protein [Propionibacteriaceae bacterium]|jgi:putative membrane protein|nr:phage holin family protein [Propionibacteriaceae bacterium]
MFLRFLVRFLASAAALAVATYLLPGIHTDAVTDQDKIWIVLGVAVIFGIVNAVVKPLFKFVATPIIFLTLGLFLLVVNAMLLQLVAWLSGIVGLSWRVDDWGSAFLGALIVSVVSFILNAFFNTKGMDHR